MTSALLVASLNLEGLGREVLFELLPVGNSVKVSAVDPASGVEVSIVGPADIGTTELKRNAMAKLAYVLRKQREEARR